MQRTRWRGLGCQLIDRNNPDSDLDGRSRSVLLHWRSSTLVADLVSIKYKLVSSVPVSSLPTDVINVFSAKRNMPSSPMLPWSNPINSSTGVHSFKVGSEGGSWYITLAAAVLRSPRLTLVLCDVKQCTVQRNKREWYDVETGEGVRE